MDGVGTGFIHRLVGCDIGVDVCLCHRVEEDLGRDVCGANLVPVYQCKPRCDLVRFAGEGSEYLPRLVFILGFAEDFPF